MPAGRQQSPPGGPTCNIPKDRGWAWMCVLGAFVVNLLVVGAVSKSFTVLVVDLQQKFGTKSGETFWIAALSQCLCLVLAPVANLLSMKYCSRWVVFTGGLIMCGGLILCMFAPNLYFLYFSYGALVGIGSAAAYAPSIVTTTQYFDKRKSLANGLAVAGSGIGNFAIPPLIRFLLNYYGLQGAFLILAALMLHICVSGALLRPFKFYDRKHHAKHSIRCQTPLDEPGENVPISKIKIETCETICPALVDRNASLGNLAEYRVDKTAAVDVKRQALSQDGDIIPPDDNARRGSNADDKECKVTDNTCLSSSTEHCVEAPPDPGLASRCNLDTGHCSGANPGNHHHGSNCQQNSTTEACLGHLQEDRSPQENLLPGATEPRTVATAATYRPRSQQRPLYQWNLLTNSVFLIFAISMFLSFSGYPNIFMIVYPHARYLKFDHDPIFLVSTIGICDVVGRILFGWFADLNLVKKKHFFMGSMVVSGMMCFFMPLIKSYIGLCVLCAIFGLFAGSFMALLPAILVESLGEKRLPSAFGLVTFFMGTALIYALYLAGWLEDYTGSFHASFYFSGSVLVCGGLVCLLEPLAVKFEARKQERLQARSNAATAASGHCESAQV